MRTSNGTEKLFTNIKIKAETHKRLKIAASVMDEKIQGLVEKILSAWIDGWEIEEDRKNPKGMTQLR